MKSKLRNHLYYHWWFYVISVVLILVLWLPVFSKLAQPKDNEQINITYIGKSFDHLKLQSDLREEIPRIASQQIKRISVENAVIEGEYDLNTILRARTAGSCDFFIIDSETIEKYQMNLASYFPETDAAVFGRIFGTVGQVTEDGKLYGLACDNGMKIADYYSGKGVCKIFFNKNSVNLSDLFGGKAEQDAAIQVIGYLTGEKDVQA